MGIELFVSRVGRRVWAALREDGRLAELAVAAEGKGGAAGQVIKGRVASVLPGMQAAFVEIGQDRNGYLPASRLWLPGEGSAATPTPAPETPPLEERLRPGAEILVQVEREALASKGARLTSGITLPGRFLVFVPLGRALGISRRIAENGERERLARILEDLAERGGGYIARTAAREAHESFLRADAARLRSDWETIQRRYQSERPPAVLWEEPELTLRMLRDAPAGGFERVVTDDPGLHESLMSFLRDVDPRAAGRIDLHDGAEPLLVVSGLHDEIKKARRPRVWLKSGGYLVIEQTDALVSVDVNTGRFTGKKSQDETILRTNLEAAVEIARQLRLRDLGGIVVVDFIDMRTAADRGRVRSALLEALARDRSRAKLVAFEEEGLVQLTRERSRNDLDAVLTRTCPACDGHGRVASPVRVACDVLLEIGRLLSTDPRCLVRVRAHPEVVAELAGSIEPSHGSKRAVRLEADSSLHPDRFEIRTL